MDSSSLVHVISASSTSSPYPSHAVADSRIESATRRTVSEGVSRTVLTVATTVTLALADTEFAVAVIAAPPLPTARTRPVESTVATDSSPDSQVIRTPGIGTPCASVAWADRRTVSPTDRAASSGVTVTAATSRPTLTVADPVAEPAAAVIVASPSHRARTSPVESTTATAVSSDAHVTVTPSTAWPFASTGSAARRSVSPRAENSRAAGDTPTELTTWATVTVALSAAEPAVAVTAASPLPTDRTKPSESTGATDASLLAHVTRRVGHEATVLVVHLRGQPRGVAQSREFERTRTYGYPCRLGRVRRDRLVTAAG